MSGLPHLKQAIGLLQQAVELLEPPTKAETPDTTIIQAYQNEDIVPHRLGKPCVVPFATGILLCEEHVRNSFKLLMGPGPPKPGACILFYVNQTKLTRLPLWLELHGQHAQHWRIHSCDPTDNAPGSDLSQVFFEAATAGHEDVCHWLLKTQPSRIFTAALRCDSPPSPGTEHTLSHDPHTVCRILKHHGLPKRGDVHGFKYLTSVLEWAAAHGDLDLCRLVKSCWDGSGMCIVAKWALIEAAKHGHVNILRFFRHEWKLTSNDARTNYNEALRMAAWYGHLDVLKCLKEEWLLTAEDARAEENSALCRAAWNGHVHVLHFLKDAWGLTEKDARSESYCAFAMAAKRGRLAVLHFLKDHWGLTTQDVRHSNCFALREALEFGHIEVAHFLTNWLASEVTPSSAIECNTLAELEAATQKGTSLVLVYATDCGGSALFPLFYRAAAKAAVPFYAIDEGLDRRVHRRYRAGGFPSVVRVVDGQVVDIYQGTRTWEGKQNEDDLLNFARGLPQKV